MDNYRARQGPVTKQKLEELFSEAQVSAFSLGWRQGLKDWTPLGDIPELEDSFVVTEEVRVYNSSNVSTSLTVQLCP